jgi:hypothetical protein
MCFRGEMPWPNNVSEQTQDRGDILCGLEQRDLHSSPHNDFMLQDQLHVSISFESDVKVDRLWSEKPAHHTSHKMIVRQAARSTFSW